MYPVYCESIYGFSLYAPFYTYLIQGFWKKRLIPTAHPGFRGGRQIVKIWIHELLWIRCFMCKIGVAVPPPILASPLSAVLFHALYFWIDRSWRPAINAKFLTNSRLFTILRRSTVKFQFSWYALSTITYCHIEVSFQVSFGWLHTVWCIVTLKHYNDLCCINFDHCISWLQKKNKYIAELAASRLCNPLEARGNCCVGKEGWKCWVSDRNVISLHPLPHPISSFSRSSLPPPHPGSILVAPPSSSISLRLSSPSAPALAQCRETVKPFSVSTTS